jgi:pimeloyl-ACP methyl ester carboxylesterase
MNILKKTSRTLLSLLIINASTLVYAQNDQYMYFFSHGLGGNKDQAHYYQQKEEILGTPVATFDYLDVLPHGYNAQEVNLGQTQDVATLKQEFEKIKNDGNGIIAFGVSRGAATLVNFLGANHCPEIKAVILESPFDNVRSIIGFKYYISALHAFVSMVFPKYNPYGMQPITSAPTIRTDLPILIVCSKKDSLVPCSSSVSLYHALKKTGNNNVYLLKVTKGSHANILWGPQGENYRNVVHAFYKKYGLPYNEKFAALGLSELAMCQP